MLSPRALIVNVKIEFRRAIIGFALECAAKERKSRRRTKCNVGLSFKSRRLLLGEQTKSNRREPNTAEATQTGVCAASYDKGENDELLQNDVTIVYINYYTNFHKKVNQIKNFFEKFKILYAQSNYDKNSQINI